MATGLALDYYFRGEQAVVDGWIRRAHRLLKGIERCPELGWLSIAEAHMALRADHDPATAQELSARAVALGRSLGDINLEMLALAYEGCALADQGKIAEGMHCLDEAAAAAVAGEMSHLYAIAMTYCCLIYTCERVRDFNRVAQWCADEEKINLAGLSRREVEVLRLVAQALNNQESAAQLVLSKHTVHRHLSNFLTKLDLPSRAAAAIYAARHDLL